MKPTKKTKSHFINKFTLFSVILFVVIFVSGSVAFIFSMQQIIRTNKGNELTQKLEIERISLESYVQNEISIALKMASSPAIVRYFIDPYDALLETSAFEEIAAYRGAFASNNVFWINDSDRKYYFGDEYVYTLDIDDPSSNWYIRTLSQTELYGININYDIGIKKIMLWVNVPVRYEGQTVGIVGTGVDVSSFIDTLFKRNEEAAQLLFFNAAGEITGSKNLDLVTNKISVNDELNDANIDFISIAKKLGPKETLTFDTPLGKIAVSAVPALGWYSAAISPDSIGDYYNTMTVLFLVIFAVIALIFIALNLFVLKSAQETVDIQAIAIRTNKSLKIKFILVFILFSIVLFSVIAVNSVRQIQQAVSVMVSISGMPALERLREMIDGDKYEALIKTLDESDPFFQETQEIFRQIKKETQCMYIYSMAYDADGVHRFIFDGEEPGSKNYSPLGAVEDVSSYDRAYMQTYETKKPQFTRMMTQLEWGRLISLYMPVFNSKGDVVGVTGIDFQGEDIYAVITSNLNLQIVFAIIFIAIGFLFYSFVLKDLARQNEILFTMSRETDAANRAKSDFLAKMSHEIRTPMNAILGITQMQIQKGGLTEEYASAFDTIYNSGGNLLGIINDILDLSKIEAGKLELHPIEYDLPSLINDAAQLNSVRIGSKPIDFILDIDENLPSRFFGDELRLKQILNNLLSNAIKYTEKGYVKLSVSCFAEGEDIMLRFSVEDTGQGLKQEDKERLFSKYQRFNTNVNRFTEGTGIGLNITQSLVSLMGGTIEVESEFGKGSVFTVAVRQQAVDCTAIGTEPAQKLRNFTFTGERQISKIQMTFMPMPYGKVLIVDDVDTNLYVAKGMMAAYKLQIETVASGFAAIEKVESGSIYDVIFMDHMMPQMDGIETTQKLRALGYKGVIVALTANALVGNDEMFKQKGFDGFISKPIDVMQLNDALNKFVRDRHPEEARKYTQESTHTVQDQPTRINPEVFQIFCGDAKKAIATLCDTAASGDIKLFATTAHAMKSALANVGEHEASKLAGALETAGQDGDGAFISANTEFFIETLLVLIQKFTTTKTDHDDADAPEDKVFLTEQLQIIKTACEEYDDTAAYAALDRLKEKPWKPETSSSLEKIRDMLFLHSDFEEAGEQIKEVLDTLREGENVS